MRYVSRLLAVILVVCFMSAGARSGERSVIAPGARLQKLAGDFLFTEGPAVDRTGNIYFTDQPNDRILIWSTRGELLSFLQPSGRANGLCFDKKGNLWVCADEKNELWVIGPGKEIRVIIKDYQGKSLNGPNDLWLTPKGGLYLTDPLYPRKYWVRGQQSQMEGNWVYYLPDGGKALQPVITDLRQPNGIIGTPDGKRLYISDLGDRKTYRYLIARDGSLTGKELFCNMGSDGMTVDSEGNVYLTGKGVTIWDPAGRQIEHIEVPEPWTGNVCFGGKDRRWLFITAGKGIYGLRMRVKGVGSQ